MMIRYILQDKRFLIILFLINLFGTRGRGNTGSDLNTIPTAAIKRVEILRDGASAQYGSDAIAGVINVILKDRNHGFEGNAF